MTIISLVSFVFSLYRGYRCKKRLMRTQTRPMIYPKPNPPPHSPTRAQIRMSLQRRNDCKRWFFCTHVQKAERSYQRGPFMGARTQDSPLTHFPSIAHAQTPLRITTLPTPGRISDLANGQPPIDIPVQHLLYQFDVRGRHDPRYA